MAPMILRTPLGLLALLSLAAAVEAAPPRRLEPIGEAALPTGLRFSGTEVGGLSGLTWDPRRGVFYAISDDRGEAVESRGPARFYTLAIDLADGRLDPGDVAIIGVTEIRDQGGGRFAPGSLDPEGIALTSKGTLLISSEGDARQRIAPFVRELTLDGSPLRSLPVPGHYLPTEDRGVRSNQGFEPLTLTPDGRTLFTATENALVQDGPAADLGVRSPARLLVFDLPTAEPTGEYLYWTEPVAAPPVPPDALKVNGLVELLALDGETLLALERSFSMGAGFTLRLFQVSLQGATSLLGRVLLEDPTAIQPAAKTLLLELGDLGVPLDNLEGIALGPRLPDGRRALLLIADNNFNSEQRTLLVALALSEEPLTIPRIQGPGHRSPLAGSWVLEVPGIVTAVESPREGGRGGHGFWLQSEQDDGDPATSEGLYVRTGDTDPELLPGDRVVVSGRVEEFGRPGELAITRLLATPGSGVRRLERGAPLPAPVRLGNPGGRRPPAVTIDDDELALFDPDVDGLDFWESLEGMRVVVEGATVVGPSNRFGGFVVVPAEVGTGLSSHRGGLVLRPGDANPERLAVDTRLVHEPPELNVGDRFSSPLQGILHYGFSSFQLLVTEALPAATALGPPTDPTHLRGDPEHLTVATWNLWNLDPGDGPERFGRIAGRIVSDLGAPDIVALQEVQDASGPEDDGVTDGRPTFELLVEAVAAAGGPHYIFRQIDPLDGLEGGQPGGNIRVGYLIDPRRVEVVDRGHGGALEPTEAESFRGRPRLTLSPGRVAPLEPAFAGRDAAGFEGSRRPLALEARFAGRTLFLVNAHLSSKGGDDRLFGGTQPPRRPSENQRSHQAARIAELVETLLALDPEAPVLVLGDLNEHEFRSPVLRLAASGLEDLVSRLPPADRYSYNFEGNSQVLDHILVSRTLAEAAEIDIVHTDADAADGLRASDHDAMVARLRF